MKTRNILEFMSVDAVRAFRSRVHESPTCWAWVGAAPSSGDGYGFFSIGPRSERAHRVAYALHHRAEIPRGMFVCHTCDNRLCVNPAHLFLGSATDNNRDRAKKGRSGIRRGEKNHGAKLTDASAREIAALYGMGNIKQSDLARRYGVSQATVSKIVLGQRGQ